MLVLVWYSSVTTSIQNLTYLDMTGASKFKYRSCDPDHALLG